MNPKDRTNGAGPQPQRWLVVCVVAGVMVGAGGLLPALLGSTGGPLAGEAAAERGADPAGLPPAPSPAMMLGRLAAGTVFVLALCAGTLPLLRRWVVPGPAAPPGGAFEVVATLPLTGRSCVSLVRVGDQHLLAGVDAAGLQVLLPVGDVPTDGGLAPREVPPPRRAPAGIDPRRLSAV